MPPDSSKKRSKITVSSVGRAAERGASGAPDTATICSGGRAASRPTVSISQRLRRAAASSLEPLLDLLAAAARPPATVHRLRPGASPSQNGIDGGWPCASSTRTVPRSTRKIRYEVLPSWNTSPCRLSTAKSSFTVPTEMRFGLEHHPVVRVVRNGAAGGDRRQPARPCAAAASC